jgi:hypothetical protein
MIKFPGKNISSRIAFIPGEENIQEKKHSRKEHFIQEKKIFQERTL